MDGETNQEISGKPIIKEVSLILTMVIKIFLLKEINLQVNFA